MNPQARIKTVLTLAAVAMAVFAGSAQALQGQLGILTSETLGGNNPATGEPWAPGDQYRFVFHTSGDTTAESADIATYNAWVQSLAEASTVYDIGADDGVTWKAIGSTDTIDARDNTLTNPELDGTGHAIFLLDGGTVVANDFLDLWDGEIQHIINLTEQGTERAHWPYTGTYIDGTKAPGHGASFGALGATGDVHQGQAAVTTNWVWRQWTGDPPETLLPMYALSDPLVIVGEVDANIPDVDAGADMITWSGQAVQLDPNVVEKPGSDWTSLTYLWTADPDDGVVFSDAAALAPTVTIIKPTDNPSVVTLTLEVNNEGRLDPPVTSSMKIDVYDDACQAATNLGQTVVYDPTDFNRDCVTNFEDFAAMAATWLDDYILPGPVPK